MKNIFSFYAIIISLFITSTVTAQRQRALITGASKGIGLALTLNLLDRGIEVVGIARTDAARMNKIISHQNFTYISADLTTAEGINHVHRSLINGEYYFDYIVHNAGMMMPPSTNARMNLQDIETTLMLNLLAPMKLSHIITPMLRPHARILMVSSRAAVTPFAELAPYCVSKAGLNMFTQILKKEINPSYYVYPNSQKRDQSLLCCCRSNSWRSRYRYARHFTQYRTFRDARNI